MRIALVILAIGVLIVGGFIIRREVIRAEALKNVNQDIVSVVAEGIIPSTQSASNKP